MPSAVPRLIPPVPAVMVGSVIDTPPFLEIVHIHVGRQNNVQGVFIIPCANFNQE